MTINDRLRAAGIAVRDELERGSLPSVPTNLPVPRVRRALAGTAVIIVVIGLVWLNLTTHTPDPTDPGAGDVALTEAWLNGALEGWFDEIAGLTYGEFGEPAALAEFALTLNHHQVAHGVPIQVLSSFTAVGTDHRFVCIHLDFGAVDIRGGMVVRDWPDVGRRLWEFRPGMVGCADVSGASTTIHVDPEL